MLTCPVFSSLWGRRETELADDKSDSRVKHNTVESARTKTETQHHHRIDWKWINHRVCRWKMLLRWHVTLKKELPLKHTEVTAFCKKKQNKKTQQTALRKHPNPPTLFVAAHFLSQSERARLMLTSLPGRQFTAAFVYWDAVYDIKKSHFHTYVCWFSRSQNPPGFFSVGNWTSNCWPV